MSAAIIEIGAGPRGAAASTATAPTQGEPVRQSSAPVLFGLLREGWRRHCTRAFLSQLDERMLRDIGVTPAEADYEANKPFWRA
jgi:uncharacterized protein YjiS (DUF1127 family)